MHVSYWKKCEINTNHQLEKLIENLIVLSITPTSVSIHSQIFAIEAFKNFIFFSHLKVVQLSNWSLGFSVLHAFEYQAVVSHCFVVTVSYYVPTAQGFVQFLVSEREKLKRKGVWYALTFFCVHNRHDYVARTDYWPAKPLGCVQWKWQSWQG